MKLTLLILLLTGFAFGQDYGPNPTNKDGAVKMHFAIKLLRGVDKAQEDFLLRGIANRRAINEQEASRLFTTEELRDTFFAIGRTDITSFKQMYQKGTIREKKAIFEKLTRDEKDDARRVNYAWGIGYLNLNEVQIDFLLRLSKKLPTITNTEISVFATEAAGLFSKETGTLLFGSIGPYDQCTASFGDGPLPADTIGNCHCNMESSFNACSVCGPGVCRGTEENCGFAWLRPCDGLCR